MSRLGVGYSGPQGTFDLAVAGVTRLGEELQFNSLGSIKKTTEDMMRINTHSADRPLQFTLAGIQKMLLESDKTTIDNFLEVKNNIKSENIFIKDANGEEINLREAIGGAAEESESLASGPFSLGTNSPENTTFSLTGNGIPFIKADITTNRLFLGSTSAQEPSVSIAGDLCITADFSGCPDYVFEEDYDLRSIAELNTYLKENNHMPGVKSAKELQESGKFDVVDFNFSLLEKIEELALYTIDQEERIVDQSQTIEEKDTKIENLESRLNELENLVNQLVEKK